MGVLVLVGAQRWEDVQALQLVEVRFKELAFSQRTRSCEGGYLGCGFLIVRIPAFTMPNLFGLTAFPFGVNHALGLPSLGMRCIQMLGFYGVFGILAENTLNFLLLWAAFAAV